MSISTVTSEALQLKLRQLLPSQQGFGTDLSASDTIIPIIDLTAAAEGSDVPQYLQTALAFGSQTAFSAANSTDVVANTAGFWRVVGTGTNGTDSSGNNTVSFQLTDGATTVIAWKFDFGGTSTVYSAGVSFDLTFFLASGITLNAVSNEGVSVLAGSARQVADINGTLVQPVGFTPQ